jgi:nucleotide-binding universal stress UspA family protein
MAMTFVNHTQDSLLLHSVFPHASITPTETAQITRSYESFLGPQRTLTVDTVKPGKEVYEVIVDASIKVKPDLIVMGAGKDSSKGGRLGSVVQALINRSTRNLLVVRPAARPPTHGKLFLLTLDGSEASRRGIDCLVKLLNPNDEVLAITLSNHHGDKDKKILGLAEEQIKKSNVKKVSSQFFPRDQAKTIGEQIAEISEATEVDIIVCVSGQKSLHTLGSTSVHLVLNTRKHVMVIKIPTEYDEFVQMRMQSDTFW